MADSEEESLKNEDRKNNNILSNEKFFDYSEEEVKKQQKLKEEGVEVEAAAMAAILASKMGTFHQDETNENLKNFPSLSTDPSCSNVESLERRKKRPMDYEINFNSLGSRGRSVSRRTAYGDEESETTLSLQRRRAQQKIIRNEVNSMNFLIFFKFKKHIKNLYK